VVIVVEAFDILLITCHSHSLNLFVESFLRMVQKLLECPVPDMQCLAVESVSYAFFYFYIYHLLHLSTLVYSAVVLRNDHFNVFNVGFVALAFVYNNFLTNFLV